MIDIYELIDRLEAASGPNYALEVDIFKLLHPEYDGYVEGRGGLVHPQDGSDQRVQSDVRPLNYTASIDTALSMARQLLPSMNCWGVDADERGVEAHVQRNGVEEGHWASFAYHKTSAPIALCMAVLLAVRDGKA